MKKIIFIFLLISLFSIINIFSIPKPKKNTGALIGKIYLDLAEDWKANFGEMRSGQYYKGRVYLYEFNTKKRYETYSDLNGNFSFLNIPAGSYTIYRFDYKHETIGGYFTIPTKLGKTGIMTDVQEGTITVEKTIIITRRIAGEKKMTDAYSFTQELTTEINRVDETEILKKEFRENDNRNLWGKLDFILVDKYDSIMKLTNE